MVVKENKTFEQALQAVRPGSKVIQGPTDTPTANNNQKPQQPTTQASGNTSNSATANNPDSSSNADDPANDPFNGGTIKGGNIDHEPELGLPNNRIN